MERCPHCGAEARPGDTYCLNCGNKLQIEQTVAIPAGGASVSQGATVAVNTEWASSASKPTIAMPLSNNEPSTLYMQSDDSSNDEQQQASAKLVLKSEEETQEFPLDKAEIYIGRSQNNDIVLSNDKLTSRRHAIIKSENGVFQIVDLGSSNGTFVNDQEVREPLELHMGDRISIGEHELVFQNSASTPSAPDVEEQATRVIPGSVENIESMETSFIDMEQEEPVEDEQESVAEEVLQTPAPANKPEMKAGKAAKPSSVPSIEALSKVEPLPDLSILNASYERLLQQASDIHEQMEEAIKGVETHDESLKTLLQQVQNNCSQASAHLDAALLECQQHNNALLGELSTLIQDVVSNPRDIDFMTALAKRAKELNSILQSYQQLISAAGTSNEILKSSMSES